MRYKIIKTSFLIMLAAVLLSGCALASGKKYTLTVDRQTGGKLIVRSPEFKQDAVLSEGDTLKIKENTAISVEAAGDTGFTYALWNETDVDSAILYLTVKEDITLSAVFEKKEYIVTLDESGMGNLTVNPPVVSGNSYPANTVFTITAEPDAGYELDTVYYSVPGPGWASYYESNESGLEVSLTSDMSFGACYLEAGALDGLRVMHNIVYAQPGIKTLKYDIYSPDTSEALPLVVIVHGGGWQSNSEDVMRGMAREMALTQKFVAASIDYRWIAHKDHDTVPNTLDDLIGDVYGAIAHLIENADLYGVDDSRIFITGDSAGGHLSASAATMIERIGTGENEILPTYLPKKMSADELKEHLLTAVKAAAPTYGVFNLVSPAGSVRSTIMQASEDSRMASSPIFNIPESSTRAIPHLLILGTEDPLIKDSDVQDYADALEAAGQTADYIKVQGAGHAFFDWKPDDATQATFKKFGIPYIENMLTFFEAYI